MRTDWAHSHWVWLSSSQANQVTETELVQGYLSRNIPVRLPLLPVGAFADSGYLM